MHKHSTSSKIKALRERGRKMARARWELDRARRDCLATEIELQLTEADAINLPRNQGDAIGILQWTDFQSGKVRRWTVRVGDRADRYTMHAPDGRATASHGWTWILDHLRGFRASVRQAIAAYDAASEAEILERCRKLREP
jgi:hypothetical protein